ncbi:sigma 54-interacting transcriptional regulator [Desulfovibrio sp. OttesenSCG-928-C06]|nr:sigma 54-interacting transcriptional regulator [Desulfovibrio sp. OttesenSCG-928-C06]
MPDTSFFEVTAEVQAVLAAVPNPVIGVDTRGVIRLCNEAMLELLKKEPPGVFGQHIQDVMPESRLGRVANTGKKEKWRKFALNGRSFLVNRSPLRIDGRLTGALASLHDVSDLEHISSELKSVRTLTEELENIIETTQDGIFVTNADGITLRVNESYCRITGLRREDVIGHSMYDMVARKIYDQSTTIRVLETGQPITLIQTIKNGATVMVSGSPVRDQHGNIVRVVTAVRDLTELNRLRDELTAMDSLKSRYENEIRKLKQQVPQPNGFIAQSGVMRSLLDFCGRLGAVDTTVLIQGKSGVGKEMIAEFIHTNSIRAGKPFIKINCAAIPEQLLESELFGYAKGAFTGADRDGKPGLFEAADGGTLLLDEIGDLPVGLQVKLLRVLQDKQTRRIGSTASTRVDVRILAATNQDLEALVRQKLFREDLFYRLNVVPVAIPPLCERKEDILALVRAFLEKFCRRHKLKREIHPAVMPLLLDYQWPGNVRELENMLERLVVTSAGPVITIDDLPAQLRPADTDPIRNVKTAGKTLKEILENVERQVIGEAVTRYGNSRRAAEVLGIDQSNVVRKAKKLGIRLPGERRPGTKSERQ